MEQNPGKCHSELVLFELIQDSTEILQRFPTEK